MLRTMIDRLLSHGQGLALLSTHMKVRSGSRGVRRAGYQAFDLRHRL